MSWVVEHAVAIKRGCWLTTAALLVLTVFGVTDLYRRQREMKLEEQQALLDQRSTEGYFKMVRHLAVHKLQQSLLQANPPPPGCLPDEYIAQRQRTTAALTANVYELAQYTLRVPISQMAISPSPQTPRISLKQGLIQMTSRQFLGYSCNGRYAVIQETRTQIQPQPLPPLKAVGPVFFDGFILHIALTQGQGPTLYYLIRFTSGKTEYLPTTAAGWSHFQPTSQKDGERFFAQHVSLSQALSMRSYSQPMAPNFLLFFLRSNGLGFSLLAGAFVCLLLINWLVAHLIEVSVVHHQAATRDCLTGLYNRRAAMALAEVELVRAKRKPSSLCVLILDIDRFKQVNDTYGHDGGDKVLAFFAQLLTRTVRQQDLVARIGGEEFLILLPDTNLTGAQIMAHTLVRVLRTSTVQYAGRRFCITCSLGVTDWRGHDESLSALLIRADLLLYQAKQQGRNRYVSAEVSTPSSTAYVLT